MYHTIAQIHEYKGQQTFYNEEEIAGTDAPFIV